MAHVIFEATCVPGYMPRKHVMLRGLPNLIELDAWEFFWVSGDTNYVE